MLNKIKEICYSKFSDFEIKDSRLVKFKNTECSSVKIPDKISHIGERPFSDCNNLKEIEIGDSVEDISYTAFTGCDSLELINVSPSNSFFTSVDGVLYSKDMTQLIKFPSGKKAEKFIIPDSVTQLWNDAFFDCRNVGEIEMGNGVTSFGSNVFLGCSSLKKIKLSENITCLDEWAFENCESLEEIYLPEKITKIGIYVFSDCISLNRIKLPATIEFIHPLAFDGCCNLMNAEIYSGDKSIEYSLERKYGLHKWDILKKQFYKDCEEAEK